jgi:ssDNA-binding Zn-finger/Zn-ribbon topoisomerase 1
MHPRCPLCNTPLKIRRRHANGTKFLGCTRFPICRHTQPLPDVLEDERELVTSLEADNRALRIFLEEARV